MKRPKDKTFTFALTGEIDIVAKNEAEALEKLYKLDTNGLLDYNSAELIGIIPEDLE